MGSDLRSSLLLPLLAAHAMSSKGTAPVDCGGVGAHAAEDDSDRIIGAFERAPQLGQYFLLYPTGSGKTRKGAIFMLHLLRKGHVTRVVVIVPRHSLKRDTLLTYQAVFETQKRTQPDMKDVLKILTRKEFVNEWNGGGGDDWWSCNEVYGVFVDEFHTIISRSAAMVNESCKEESDTSFYAVHAALTAPSTPPPFISCGSVGSMGMNDIIGYKGHARDAINQMRRHCPHNIFMCATATPFFTIFDKEVKMWVQIFEPSAATTVSDAMAYFGQRMITPTKDFVERVYAGVSVEIMGENGVVGKPRMTEICAPVSVSDFPVTGCKCGKCEREECYIERVMNEIESAVTGKHFVVTYRYFVRDLLLAKLRSNTVNGTANAEACTKAQVWPRKQGTPQPHAYFAKRRFERSVNFPRHFVLNYGGYGGGGGGKFRKKKRMRTVGNSREMENRVRNVRIRVGVGCGVGAKKKTPPSAISSTSSSSSSNLQEQQLQQQQQQSKQRLLHNRTFLWKESVRVFFVLPDDPTNVVIQVRDEFNGEKERCIMVTNIFFCEGHTLRNVTHMHVLGAFPTYECGTMFQAFGRICRMKSHDAPTTVKVFMYDDDRMLHYRISKAVEKENDIRNGIKHMIETVEAGRQQQYDGKNKEIKNELKDKQEQQEEQRPTECHYTEWLTADESANCGGKEGEVDYSQLAAPYLHETEVTDPPNGESIHQMVSRFKQSRYCFLHSEGTGMCLQDVSVSDNIRRRNKETGALVGRQRELKNKRGVQPQRYHVIRKFINKRKLGANCIFISIPEEVVRLMGIYKEEEERRLFHVDHGDMWGGTAVRPPAKKKAPVSATLSSRRKQQQQQQVVSIKVEYAGGPSGENSVVMLPVTDVVIYNVRRHIICNEICRKMAKGALLINMPLSNIKLLQSAIQRERRKNNKAFIYSNCLLGESPWSSSSSSRCSTSCSSSSGDSNSTSSSDDDDDNSCSSNTSSSCSNSADDDDDDDHVGGHRNRNGFRTKKTNLPRGKKSLTRTRCDLIRDILEWAAEAECILVMK